MMMMMMMYQVNNDFEYPKKEYSMHGYLKENLCYGNKADGINLLFALPSLSVICIGRSIVHVRQTWGWKAPGIGWATLSWVSCITDTFDIFV